MRIIAGNFKGRKIECPKGNRVRPTSDMVRTGVFNMLGNLIDFEGLQVADICCGTGAYGIEAISRGAEHVSFVDNHIESIRATKLNLEKLAITNAEVLNLQVEKLGTARQPYDLLFIDPPYLLGLVDVALISLIKGGWITEHSILVMETKDKEAIKAESNMTIIKERFYGNTRILIAKIAV
jgi:16S rRNA (guanine966-N2)-methyltransferase